MFGVPVPGDKTKEEAVLRLGACAPTATTAAIVKSQTTLLLS